LALALTRGNKVLYVKGYGKDGNGQEITPETQFFIASVLTDRKPPTAGLSVKQFGIIFGIFAIIVVLLQLTGFYFIKKRKQVLQNGRSLRQFLLIGLNFAPVVLLLLPYLILLGTGRYFGFLMLSVAMPDLMLLIVACALIGIIKGIVRLKLIFYLKLLTKIYVLPEK
jgi:hypothetical protein